MFLNQCTIREVHCRKRSLVPCFLAQEKKTKNKKKNKIRRMTIKKAGLGPALFYLPVQLKAFR